MPSTDPTRKDATKDIDETVIHVTTTNPERQHAVSVGVTPTTSSKKLPIVVLVLFLVVVGVIAYSFSSSNSSNSGTAALSSLAPAQVSITSDGFIPATISVKVGQAVTWTNTDSAPHIVASDPYPNDNALAGFDSKQDLYKNDHYSFVFNKVGTYTYHDDLNPYTFEGTVIVKK